MQATRPWTRAWVLVGLANAAFLAISLWAGTLPREPLATRVREAFASGDLIEDDWPGLDSRHGFDQYNDCSILQMITNRDDNILAHAVGPLIYNKNDGEIDKCATLRSIVTEGPQVAPLVFRYTRYWHGYNPVTAALLLFLDVGQARTALTLTLFGALTLLVAAAGTQHRALFAVAASIAVTGSLFWAIPYFGPCFTHAPGDIFLVLGLACLFRWRQRLATLNTLVPFCAVYGAGVTCLEFLTGQLPTAAGLLFATTYLIARARPEPNNHPRHAWRFALAGLLAFGLGAVLTVVIKQVLAVVVVGPEAVSSFFEYLGRYVNPSPGASLNHFRETWASPDDSLLRSTLKSFYVVLKEGANLTYGSRPAAVLLYAGAGLAWLTAGCLAFRKSVRWARSDFLALAVGASLIVLWTWTFQTHTTIHKFWMVRMLLVPLSLAWGGLAWQLLLIPVEHRATAAASERAGVSA